MHQVWLVIGSLVVLTSWYLYDVYKGRLLKKYFVRWKELEAVEPFHSQGKGYKYHLSVVKIKMPEYNLLQQSIVARWMVGGDTPEE